MKHRSLHSKVNYKTEVPEVAVEVKHRKTISEFGFPVVGDSRVGMLEMMVKS